VTGARFHLEDAGLQDSILESMLDVLAFSASANYASYTGLAAWRGVLRGHAILVPRWTCWTCFLKQH